MSNVRTAILKEAMEAIDGSRDEQYGSPEDNFKRIARLWSEYLSAANEPHEYQETVIEPQDVANMMILLKIARTMHDPEVRDNWVDIAGYAACAGEITSR